MSEQAALFPPQEEPNWCSYDVCVRGHKTPARLTVAECKGCQGLFVARQLRNCPMCGDAIDRTVVSIQHIQDGGHSSVPCKDKLVMPGMVSEVELLNMVMREAEERDV